MTRAKKSAPSPPGLAQPAAAPRFENIEWLVDGEGDITIGTVGPIRCAATAANEDQSLAMLVRREGETLFQFMARLDTAIAKALDEDVFIDEINNGPSDAL
ncbi:MAG: hypothetical protein ABJA83_15280 [Burkholderiaceae bacterium]